MLEKNRFLAIKNLAKDIRKENEKLFKAFAKESMEDAIREKEEFIESVIDSMEIAFSDGEQGKEEKQIFRANILIPDDLDFFTAYSKDKNIRNLMNQYAVSIEDIMSKITELNIYGKYIETFKTDDEPQEEDFVDEMVNLSSKEAESLLDEIENLSNVMEELNIPTDEEETKMEPEVVANAESFEQPEENDVPAKAEITSDLGDEFEDISNAVSGFVDDYNKTQEELNGLKAKLDKAQTENDTLKVEIESLKNENDSLKKNNLDSVNALTEARDAKNLLENQNIELREQMMVMEKKIKQSADLIKKIYNSIPRK